MQDFTKKRVLTTPENQERVRWIDYYGNKYLLLDFSGLTDIEAFRYILQARRTLSLVKENSAHVILDMSNVDLSYNTHATLKKVCKEYQKYIFKSSIVGMNDATKLFYPLYKLFTKSKSVSHDTREEALVYLFGNISMSA